MSNLGLHFLYAGLRRSAALRVERFFADTAPYTVETASDIATAPVLFFSVSYEEDFVGLVRILHRAGIAPLADDRSLQPVVIAGGMAVSANPAAIADIVDAAVLGEGETVLGDIVELLAGRGGSGGEELLAELAAVRGVFIPRARDAVARFAPQHEYGTFPHSVIATPNTVFRDTVLIETGRGCPGRCVFCLARGVYGTARFSTLERIAEAVDGFRFIPRRAGLVSTSVAAHPRFAEIVAMLAARGMRPSFSSLRVGDLDDHSISAIASVGTKSVSLAPESGSERLRRRIGKSDTDDSYFEAAGRLYEAGVRHFNLYLLAGLPGEGPDDLADTARFLSGFKQAAGGIAPTVHVNIAVPKAWTPLWFNAVPSPGFLERRLASITRICAERGIAVRAKTIRSALRQALLSTAGSEVGRGIASHVIDGLSWNAAMAREGVDVGAIHRRRGIDSLPGALTIEGPVPYETLLRRFERCVGGDGEGGGT
jgi:radical SAM superfamily enzyme YgiQ (UPF0313 family)